MNSSSFDHPIEGKLRDATRMPSPRPEFLASLRVQLAVKQLQRTSLGERLKMAFHRRSTIAASSILVILLAAFVIVGPQKVIAAVQQLIGYIPGIGFVQDTETVRVLEEPVIASQNGITVTVEDAVADSNSTRINLRVDGPAAFLQYYNQPGAEIPEGPRRLILADGTEISLRSWGVRIAKSWLSFQLLFDPLPENVSEATLVFDPVPGGAAEKWQIPLRIRPGKNDANMAEATLLNLSSQEMNGVTLILENIAQTNGMDVLKVSVKTNDADLHLDPNWENNLILVDRDGNKLLLSPTASIVEEGTDVATLQTPILVPGRPYTLKLQGPVIAIRNIPFEDTASRFTLDLGVNPQPGQSWGLDQILEVDGRRVHLTGVRLLAGNTCGLSYSTETTTSLVFDFDEQPDIADLMVITTDATAQPWRIYANACIVYPETPSGLLNFKVNNISIPVEGNWEITWQAPSE